MKTSSCPESVRQHRNRFAVATILAGVGLLALAWPADAQVVYTPTNITISEGKYKLDINNDGVTDFTIAVSIGQNKNPPCQNHYYTVQERPSSDNCAQSSRYPAELVTGDEIGPNQTFYAGRGVLLSWHRSCKTYWTGNWVLGQPGYLGLSFQVNGETYYGWAQLTITSAGDVASATLTGYAYESTPGMPINAGQTQ